MRSPWPRTSIPGAQRLLELLYPHAGKARTLGITGPPGVGKSSLIAALCTLLRARDLTVGVITVDPSSHITHGALLGDRIRLVEHFLDAGVYIRSMGTRGHLGGVAEATLLAGVIVDASGRDVLLYETVGVGQSEVEVAALADTVALVLMPGSGDSIQALKAGVMEIPDVIVVNKADHPALERTRAELAQVLSLADPERRPVVLETVATTASGIEELWAAIEAHQASLEAARRPRGAPQGAAAGRAARTRLGAHGAQAGRGPGRQSRPGRARRCARRAHDRPADRGAAPARSRMTIRAVVYDFHRTLALPPGGSLWRRALLEALAERGAAVDDGEELGRVLNASFPWESPAERREHATQAGAHDYFTGLLASAAGPAARRRRLRVRPP